MLIKNYKNYNFIRHIFFLEYSFDDTSLRQKKNTNYNYKIDCENIYGEDSNFFAQNKENNENTDINSSFDLYFENEYKDALKKEFIEDFSDDIDIDFFNLDFSYLNNNNIINFKYNEFTDFIETDLYDEVVDVNEDGVVSENSDVYNNDEVETISDIIVESAENIEFTKITESDDNNNDFNDYELNSDEDEYLDNMNKISIDKISKHNLINKNIEYSWNQKDSFGFRLYKIMLEDELESSKFLIPIYIFRLSNLTDFRFRRGRSKGKTVQFKFFKKKNWSIKISYFNLYQNLLKKKIEKKTSNFIFNKYLLSFFKKIIKNKDDKILYRFYNNNKFHVTFNESFTTTQEYLKKKIKFVKKIWSFKNKVKNITTTFNFLFFKKIKNYISDTVSMNIIDYTEISDINFVDTSIKEFSIFNFLFLTKNTMDKHLLNFYTNMHDFSEDSDINDDDNDDEIFLNFELTEDFSNNKLEELDESIINDINEVVETEDINFKNQINNDAIFNKKVVDKKTINGVLDINNFINPNNNIDNDCNSIISVDEDYITKKDFNFIKNFFSNYIIIETKNNFDFINNLKKKKHTKNLINIKFRNITKLNKIILKTKKIIINWENFIINMKKNLITNNFRISVNSDDTNLIKESFFFNKNFKNNKNLSKNLYHFNKEFFFTDIIDNVNIFLNKPSTNYIWSLDNKFVKKYFKFNYFTELLDIKSIFLVLNQKHNFIENFNKKLNIINNSKNNSENNLKWFTKPIWLFIELLNCFEKEFNIDLKDNCTYTLISFKQTWFLLFSLIFQSVYEYEAVSTDDVEILDENNNNIEDFSNRSVYLFNNMAKKVYSGDTSLNNLTLIENMSEEEEIIEEIIDEILESIREDIREEEYYASIPEDMDDDGDDEDPDSIEYVEYSMGKNKKKCKIDIDLVHILEDCKDEFDEDDDGYYHNSSKKKYKYLKAEYNTTDNFSSDTSSDNNSSNSSSDNAGENIISNFCSDTSDDYKINNEDFLINNIKISEVDEDEDVNENDVDGSDIVENVIEEVEEDVDDSMYIVKNMYKNSYNHFDKHLDDGYDEDSDEVLNPNSRDEYSIDIDDNFYERQGYANARGADKFTHVVWKISQDLDNKKELKTTDEYTNEYFEEQKKKARFWKDVEKLKKKKALNLMEDSLYKVVDKLDYDREDIIPKKKIKEDIIVNIPILEDTNNLLIFDVSNSFINKSGFWLNYNKYQIDDNIFWFINLKLRYIYLVNESYDLDYEIRLTPYFKYFQNYTKERLNAVLLDIKNNEKPGHNYNFQLINDDFNFYNKNPSLKKINYNVVENIYDNLDEDSLEVNCNYDFNNDIDDIIDNIILTSKMDTKNYINFKNLYKDFKAETINNIDLDDEDLDDDEVKKKNNVKLNDDDIDDDIGGDDLSNIDRFAYLFDNYVTDIYTSYMNVDDTCFDYIKKYYSNHSYFNSNNYLKNKKITKYADWENIHIKLYYINNLKNDKKIENSTYVNDSLYENWREDDIYFENNIFSNNNQFDYSSFNIYTEDSEINENIINDNIGLVDYGNNINFNTINDSEFENFTESNNLCDEDNNIDDYLDTEADFDINNESIDDDYFESVEDEDEDDLEEDLCDLEDDVSGSDIDEIDRENLTFFFDFKNKKLTTFRDARKVHWTFFTKKQLNARRYNNFLKFFLKNKNKYLFEIIDYFTFKFKLPYSFWLDFINLYFYFLKKKIQYKQIYQLPIDTDFWSFLKKINIKKLDLNSKIDSWILRTIRIDNTFWMQQKKNFPKFLKKKSYWNESTNNNIQYDFLTNYFIILKKYNFTLNNQSIIFKNKFLKLNNFRYKS